MSGLIYPVRQQLIDLRDGNSLLKEIATELLLKWSDPPEDPADWLDLALRSDRVAKIAVTGQQNNAELIQKLMHETEPKSWHDLPRLNVPEDRQRALAEHMMTQVDLFPENMLSQESQLLFNGSFPFRTSIEHAVGLFKDTHANVDVQLNDAAFTHTLLNSIDADSAQRYASFVAARRQNTTHAVNFYAEPNEDVVGKIDPEKGKMVSEALLDFRQRARDDKIRWCLADLPSEKDAEIDEMNYDEYINYYFDACDQPWEAIERAQQKLIDNAFNKGHMLHITTTGEDGKFETEVHVPIGLHTFSNSTVKRNMPGSEIFSGPNAESVTGKIVSKGNFSYTLDGELYVMKNITLTIHKGEVIEAHAEVGDEGLQKILSCEDNLDPSDPKYRGARRIGEIGIGTNPFITQHLANTMMVEKISGSFHLAVGNAYGNSYLGEKVLMDNGNKSRVHWDITTMLRGKGGRMTVDGHLLQENGVWVACPELGITEQDVRVLNEGWKAIPNEFRPPRHRDETEQNQSVVR